MEASEMITTVNQQYAQTAVNSCSCVVMSLAKVKLLKCVSGCCNV